MHNYGCIMSAVEPLPRQSKQFSTHYAYLEQRIHSECCSPHCLGQLPHRLGQHPFDSSVTSAEAGVEEEVALVAEEALTRVAEGVEGVEVVAEGVVEAEVVAVA